MYLAQQLHSYPPDYIAENDNPNRMMETVERFEEDLNDTCTVHFPRIVTAAIGEAIAVGGPESGGKRGGVIEQVGTRLVEMLKVV
jgi:hypothetical protein